MSPSVIIFVTLITPSQSISHCILTIITATAIIQPSQNISHITPSPSLLLPSPNITTHQSYHTFTIITATLTTAIISPQSQHPASLLPAGGMVQDRSLSRFLLLLLLLWGGTHHHPAAGGVSGHVLHQGESSVTCNTTGTLGMVGLWVMCTGVVGRF